MKHIYCVRHIDFKIPGKYITYAKYYVDTGSRRKNIDLGKN